MILPAVFEPAWVFYLGSVVASLVPAATITARAMASRIVDGDEVGKVFAIISFISATSSSLMSAAFQGIYAGSKDFFPGLFLLVNAGLFLMTVPTNLVLWKKLR